MDCCPSLHNLFKLSKSKWRSDILQLWHYVTLHIPIDCAWNHNAKCLKLLAMYISALASAWSAMQKLQIWFGWYNQTSFGDHATCHTTYVIRNSKATVHTRRKEWMKSRCRWAHDPAAVPESPIHNWFEILPHMDMSHWNRDRNKKRKWHTPITDNDSQDETQHILQEEEKTKNVRNSEK